jgi:hypothetical protein
MDFFKKYLKYKEKYLNLKSQSGGMGSSGKKRAREANPVDCSDNNEQNVTGCYLIIEDENGNEFRGSNGIPITGDKAKDSLCIGLTGGNNDKLIEQVLKDIMDRIPTNDQGVLFTPQELNRFNIRARLGMDLQLNKTIDNNMPVGSNPKARLPAIEITPPIGGAGGGPQPRIVTRSNKTVREEFIRRNIIRLYPQEYQYVIDGGIKIKILQTPPASTDKLLGGERNGVKDKNKPFVGKKGYHDTHPCKSKNWNETTDECLKREVEEEGNFQIDLLCTNWGENPKPQRPAVPDLNRLYVSEYRTDVNECCKKYYYIKISNAIKADLLRAYQIILNERATEFYNGAFR